MKKKAFLKDYGFAYCPDVVQIKVILLLVVFVFQKNKKQTKTKEKRIWLLLCLLVENAKKKKCMIVWPISLSKKKIGACGCLVAKSPYRTRKVVIHPLYD